MLLRLTLLRHKFSCARSFCVTALRRLSSRSVLRTRALSAKRRRYALEPLIGDGLFISDGETWRQRRRMVAPIVHISQIEKFAPIMVEAASEMRDRWAISEGATIDMLHESATLTAEIICRTIFGQKLGHDYSSQIVDSFSDYQRTIGQIDPISFLGLPDWFPRWYRPSIYRSIKCIHRVLDDVIESYRANKSTDDNSVIQHLIDARYEETAKGLAPEALRNEIAVLFMAGHETT